MYAYKQTPKFFEALIKRFFLIINKLKLYIMQYDLWVVQKKKKDWIVLSKEWEHSIK